MDKLFLGEPQTLYAGFDPTADSLHFGNLLVLIALLRFVRKGHRVICLIGDATVSLGDPSGRLDERPEIAKEVIDNNIEGVSSDISKVFANHFKYFWKPHSNSALHDPM
jgi:tyrosyl-tRNA synthetase